ncbi:MAG: FAD-dependent oxidoreductase [Bifidobacteriaceae bacterium]|jgi:succinate dehydrogenase/fumarate reductase flavoprotein subunit|nr:FAD-dependent oxidoreductase [Bifidobacteriaceae bacterium]
MQTEPNGIGESPHRAGAGDSGAKAPQARRGGAGFTRRAFLGGLGATVAVTAGGLAGCSPAKEGGAGGATGGAASPAASDGKPAFLTPPAPPEQVAEELSCDVLVIGLGLAGVTAARQAVEDNASVIGIDKQEVLSWVTMAGDFGVVGSQIQKDLGIEWAAKTDIVNQLQKDMTYRTNPALFNYWYDHSGADFDWFVEGAEFEVLTSSAANKQTDLPNYIRPKCFPPLEGYDWRTEYYPYFHGTITTNPNMDWACGNTLALAEAKGAKFLYGTAGEQLITDASGAVTGAYVRDKDGVYRKINAKTVVLATGDFGNNQAMRDYYIPWAAEFPSIYTQMDANGSPCDTGDGQLMGMWAGGEMELGPLAPMTHHMGGALGVNAYLQLNMEGRRFMNEDIPGQNIADQLSRQPKKQSWQIFDSKWPEQLASQPTGHGYVNYYVPDDKIGEYETVLAGFGLGYTTKAMVEENVTFKADTIDELAALMELPVDVVKAEIARYNELCEQGYDADFGKDPRRLYPVVEAPFYACNFGNAGMLVVMGGLNVDQNMHVLAADGQPIPGLYAAGNNMGGRFLVEYPVTVAGISLATALCFGRLAGQNAAAGI